MLTDSPQVGIGAGEHEPPRGLHSEHGCPFRPQALAPSSTGQQGLVTWRMRGLLGPRGGGQGVLPPERSDSAPTQPRSEPSGQQGSHSSHPAQRSLPCHPAEALFVCPGPSKALLSPIHALPGWHVDARPDSQPGDWPPEHAALSGHCGTRRHQCESLELGVGAWLTGAPIRGPHSELVDTGLRPTRLLHLAGPGVPKCPQVSPP